MKINLERMLLALMVASGLTIALLSAPEQRSAAVWTKAYLTERLAEIGYKAAWIAPGEYDCFTQGLFVARQGDPRSWCEIASKRPRGRAERYWRGLVLVQRDIFDTQASAAWVQVSPDEIRTHGLVFFGDPEELERIAAHLQGRRDSDRGHTEAIAETHQDSAQQPH
jgi:hypothetical protein